MGGTREEDKAIFARWSKIKGERGNGFRVCVCACACARERGIDVGSTSKEYESASHDVSVHSHMHIKLEFLSQSRISFVFGNLKEFYHVLLGFTWKCE